VRTWKEKIRQLYSFCSTKGLRPSVWSKETARCWWLTPVILATQEAEIRRIAVWSQPRQIVCENLSWKYPSQKKGWWSGSRCRLWVQAPVLKKKKRERARERERKRHAYMNIILPASFSLCISPTPFIQLFSKIYWACPNARFFARPKDT
jgi:hypothetical protein